MSSRGGRYRLQYCIYKIWHSINIMHCPNHSIIINPDYHCTSASLRSLAGMGQVRAAM